MRAQTCDTSNAPSAEHLVIEQEFAGVQHGPEDVVHGVAAGSARPPAGLRAFALLRAGLARQAGDVNRLDHFAPASCRRRAALAAACSRRSCATTVSPLSMCRACDSVGSVVASLAQAVRRGERPNDGQEVVARLAVGNLHGPGTQRQAPELVLHVGHLAQAVQQVLGRNAADAGVREIGQVGLRCWRWPALARW